MKTEQRLYGYSNALLFFAGWGMDVHPFLHLDTEGYDCFIAYDYRTLNFDTSLLSRYNEVHVVAWSMGVWAATQLLQHLPITSATAINGSELPVDDWYGIPVTAAFGTLESLSPDTLVRFQRRMCGNAEVFKKFIRNAPQRDIDELREELAAIYRQAENFPHQSFPWNRAIIGNNDRIFPTFNLHRFWQEKTSCQIVNIDAPHYPFYVWNSWKEIFS